MSLKSFAFLKPVSHVSEPLPDWIALSGWNNVTRKYEETCSFSRCLRDIQ
jgi:hypothetical protein